MVFEEILRFIQILLGLFGSVLLFIEVLKAQQVEKLRRVLEALENHGVLDLIVRYKQDKRRFYIEDIKSTFGFTGINAENIYKKIIDRTEKGLNDYYDESERKMEENIKKVQSFQKKSSPKILKLRKVYLIIGFSSVVISNIIEFLLWYWPKEVKYVL